MDARIAIREADGSFTRSDPGVRPIYSITKTFVAATVLRLGIELKRPMSDWMGADWVPRGAEIRVQHLLNHTGGLRDYGALPEYRRAVEACESPWSDDRFADATLRQPLLFEPGAAFAYSNPGYWLLTQIIERETDAPFDDALQRLVLDPLELTQTRVVRGPVESDLPAYDAGWVWHRLIVASARDTATFMASALVDPLRAGSTPVTPAVADPLWPDPHYGLGLMIDRDRYGHNGGGPGCTTSCFHFPGTGRTCCVLAYGASKDAVMAQVIDLGS
ncbi:MAG: beta-lactamase family protein [Myxococcales bacterium]|nr:beta-lactamase family protein [Myxococcales bacterium]